MADNLLTEARAEIDKLNQNNDNALNGKHIMLITKNLTANAMNEDHPMFKQL